MCTKPYINNEGKKFPCGQCLSCRIGRTKMWQRRVLNEMEYWKQKKNNAIFVTLTYNEEALPENKSLRRKDLKDYCKRLRNYMNRKYKRPIKYIGVGEYGEEEMRPHYHLIVIGMKYEESKVPIQITKRTRIMDGKQVSWFEKYEKRVNKDPEIIEAMWNNSTYRGFVDIGTDYSEFEKAIGYVTGYIQKKLLGKNHAKKYKDLGIEPPFLNVSHGMGKQWVIDHKEDIIREGGLGKWTYYDITETGKSKGPIRKVENIPKGYYRYLEQICTAEEIDKLKEKVKARGEAHEAEFRKQLEAEGVPVKEDDWLLKYPLNMISSIKKYYEKYGETPEIKDKGLLAKIRLEEHKEARRKFFERLKGRGHKTRSLLSKSEAEVIQQMKIIKKSQQDDVPF